MVEKRDSELKAKDAEVQSKGGDINRFLTMEPTDATKKSIILGVSNSVVVQRLGKLSNDLHLDI